MEMRTITGMHYNPVSEENKAKYKESGRIHITDGTLSKDDIHFVSKFVIFEKESKDFEQVKEFIANTKIWIADADHMKMLFSHTKNIPGRRHIIYVEEDGHRVHAYSEKMFDAVWNFLENVMDEL